MWRSSRQRCLTRMHVDHHLDVVWDRGTATGIDRSGDDDVTREKLPRLPLADLALEHLTEVEVREYAVATRLGALTQVGMRALAHVFPKSRQLRRFVVPPAHAARSAAPVRHPLVVRADRDAGRYDVSLEQLHELERRHGCNDGVGAGRQVVDAYRGADEREVHAVRYVDRDRTHLHVEYRIRSGSLRLLAQTLQRRLPALRVPFGPGITVVQPAGGRDCGDRPQSVRAG